MRQRITLLGSETTYPFLGHLEAQVVRGADVISVAARFSHHSNPKACFQQVRLVEEALQSKISQIVKEPPSVPDWIRGVWSFWMQQSKANYGAEAGADLSVAIYVRCAQQEAISASGVTGVWGLIEQHWIPVVKEKHPMLGQAGVPTVFPGVFLLTRSSPFFIAAPHPDHSVQLEQAAVQKRVGGRYGT